MRDRNGPGRPHTRCRLRAVQGAPVPRQPSDRVYRDLTVLDGTVVVELCEIRQLDRVDSVSTAFDRVRQPHAGLDRVPVPGVKISHSFDPKPKMPNAPKS